MTSPDNHYETMTYEDIAAFKYGNRAIRDIAARDALLFMWCTPANLLLAMDIVPAWGFEYRTHLVWVKDRAGTGFSLGSNMSRFSFAHVVHHPCRLSSRLQ